MRLGRNRAQRHRTGGETFDDFFGGFDFFDRNGFAWVDFELKQTAQCHVALGLVVDQLRIFFIGAPVVRACAVL